MILGAVLGSMVLAACSAPASAPSPPAPTAAAPTQTATTTHQSTTPAAAPTASACAELTGKEAFAKWVGEVKTTMPGDKSFDWDPGASDTSTYDACAPLSWILLSIKGPTGSSPFQVMFFNRGEFVGTATSEPFGFHPNVTRQSDAAVSVVFRWPKVGEATASASGESTSTYVWDETSRTLKRSGDLPPDPSQMGGPASGSKGGGTDAIGIPAEAYRGAGGPRPEGAKKITSIRPDEFGTGEVAVLRSPTGNIGCEFHESGAGGCGVESYIKDMKYGQDELGPRWWLGLADGFPEISSRSEAPLYAYPDVEAQKVPYGEIVYYGNFVCHSAEKGLTCWNTDTGHGVFMNRAGFNPF